MTNKQYEQLNSYYFSKSIKFERKLKRIPYGQCGVKVCYDGSVILRSYETLVCAIDSEGWLSIRGTYSRTTAKHISAFMYEYGKGLTYYFAKDLLYTDYVYNIITGEVLTLTEYLGKQGFAE